jgi:hypothetical protein
LGDKPYPNHSNLTQDRPVRGFPGIGEQKPRGQSLMTEVSEYENLIAVSRAFNCHVEKKKSVCMNTRVKLTSRAKLTATRWHVA